VTTFQDLIADEAMAKELIESCHVHGANIQVWYDQRHFVSQAIHKPGTLLDIGCANGFLLKCLLEWSTHELVLYGIEFDKQRMEVAKTLLEPFSNNILEARVNELKNLDKRGFPSSFDFI
jgi:predicted O-methyltransferase YrrM